MEDTAPLAFCLSPLGLPFPMADVAQPLYTAVDFTQCHMAGSHALRQHLVQASWVPHDIDITCDTATPEAFDKLVAAFRVAYGQEKTTLIEHSLASDRYSAGVERDAMDERYHPTFQASCTLRVEGVPLPVQFAGFNLQYFKTENETLEKRIAHITDSPASVTYSVIGNGIRAFYVPTWCANAIATGRVKRMYCPAEHRRAKYEKRGFVYE